MAHCIQLAIFAALALLSSAAPNRAPARSLAKRSFNAEAPGRRLLSPVEEVARARQKYSKHWEIVVINASGGTSSATAPAASSTSSVASAGLPTNGNSTAIATAPIATPTSGTEDGSVSADPEDSSDNEYLSPVTIGGQSLVLDFDTGSSDLWVLGASVASSEQTAYVPSKSSTWNELDGYSWVISYGDGSAAEGFVGTDVVDIGGSTVQKQAVEIATHVSGSFQENEQMDGLLGLAFSSINNVEPKQQLTFFDNVKSDLSLPVFTADLKANTGKGSYDFGTIDQSKYTGDIHYTPVDNSQGFWQITTPQILLGEQSHDCSNCSVAIVDTGTSLMYLDDDVVTEYYTQMPSAKYLPRYGLWTYPCSQAANLPGLGVGIGDWVAHINGSELNFGPLSATSSTCVGGLQSNAETSFSILGDVFLKHFFVVFDAGELRVGVADQN